jgi:dolichol kinase
MSSKTEKLIYEIRRKIFHILILIYPITYYIVLRSTGSKFLAISSLIIILICFLVMEHFRIRNGVKIPYIKELYRELESDKIGGEIYYMVGCIIVLLAFDLRIAAAAILMVNFGDALSAIVGVLFGKIKLTKTKTLEGFLAGLLINLIITILILENLIIAIPMALVGALSELFSNKINDNLSIPIFSGIAGQILKFLII